MADLHTLEGILSRARSRANGIVKDARATDSVVWLNNNHFKNGTYQITQPGFYRLGQDIVFNPNNLEMTATGWTGATGPTSWDSGDVLDSQLTTNGGEYDPPAFGLGFFAAIAISASGVVLDLNGHKISQSPEHALQQRFFSVIELADQPFLPPQGPHSFGGFLKAAKNVTIKNGTIGLSSHHGIHGNNNWNVLLEDIVFENFEVGACALNRVKNLMVVNCRIRKSRTDVPVLGIFSAGRFLRPYLNALEDGSYSGTLTLNSQVKGITEIKSELKSVMDNVFYDVITSGGGVIDKTSHLEEWRLFHNHTGVIDGNSFGFLINGEGIAVGGFPDIQSSVSTNVYMKNVVVNQLSASINEILALPTSNVPVTNSYGGKGVQNDSVGAIFQVQNRDPDGDLVTISSTGAYIGNVVANAQLLVTQAIADGFDFGSLSTSRNSITSRTIEFAEGATGIDSVAVNGIYKCNGDSMFHVNKGVIGFKMDAGDNIYMENCRCYNVSNSGAIGSDLCDEAYKNGVGKSHPDATYYGYGGAATRGWSLSSSSKVTLKSCQVSGCHSSFGNSIGYDVHQSSRNVVLDDCSVADIQAGNDSSLDLADYANNPTEKPHAYGFHVSKEVIDCQITDPQVLGEIASPYRAVAFNESKTVYYYTPFH